MTTWTETDLGDLLNELQERYRPLHNLVRWRRQQFFNDKAVSPKLPPPYDRMEVYQSDILRQAWSQLKARLTENKPVFNTSSPKKGQAEAAQRLETVLNDGYELMEERAGTSFVGDLADGLAVDCFGILHWRKASDMWPDLPKEDYVVDLPTDATKEDYYSTPETKGPNKGKYRQTRDAFNRNRQHDIARAGFPFCFEVPDTLTVYPVPDKSPRNGFAIVATVHEVSLLDYRTAVVGQTKDGKPIIALCQVDESIKVYVEGDAPRDDQPSGSAYRRKVKVATVWFRDVFYELVATAAGDSWTMVRDNVSHPYEMPPFVLIAAETFNVSDPAQRWLPAMEGLYRTKPQYDAMMAYLHALAYATAIPRYYIRHKETRLPQLAEDGKTLFLSQDSQLAQQLPAGLELVKIEFEVNEAYVRVTEQASQQMKDAKPDTGIAELTAATKPWAVRMAQAQANIQPRFYLRNLVSGLRTAMRNVALVMSKNADQGGFGEPICTYAKSKDGVVNMQSVISVDPAEIPSLMVDCEINETTNGEQTTLETLGLELLNNPTPVITLKQYLADYKGSRDPGADEEELLSESAYKEYVRPGLLKQELAKAGLLQVVVGPEGMLIGANGEQVQPYELLGRNGKPFVPQQPQQGAGASPPPAQPGGPATGATPAPMGTLAAPGTIPLQGAVA